MPEGGAGLDAASVEARLPDGWRVEETDGGVRGYADRSSEPGADASESVGSFRIRHAGGLWAASWRQKSATSCRRGGTDDRVIGVKERCVEWIVEKANGL
jgi:hypothetical protein